MVRTQTENTYKWWDQYQQKGNLNSKHTMKLMGSSSYQFTKCQGWAKDGILNQMAWPSPPFYFPHYSTMVCPLLFMMWNTCATTGWKEATEQNLKEADTLREAPILRQEPSLIEQSIEKKRTQIGENSATDSLEMTKEIRASGKCKETDGEGEEDEFADMK